VGGTLVSGTTQQCTINIKNTVTIHNTDTVAYATHSGSYSTERKRKYIYTAVHNIHSGAQHSQWCTTHT